ncbi:MAG TPA: dTDP-4-dehydrorhamnose 3,5-epimerase family protein [Thermoanaerobaculia bacterium]|nr:dTDP-4-dehydrorhamnose 3,5-epimerase family protein [Thermoanaerobaculia bacterium]
MIFRPTPVPGAWLVDLEAHHDQRGFFARAFCRDELLARGIELEVAQANVAWNGARGTLRGLHYQRPPHAEAKLVRCVRGAVFVVLVDLRRVSPAFARPWSVTLASSESTQLFIPEGVANGYQTLEDATELYYLMSSAYRAEAAAGIRYDDPSLGIEWPLAVSVVSQRDRELAPFDPERCAI